jgi:riboflavin kinase / FMN adenylyltransferase
VRVVPPVLEEGTKTSSTEIRRRIAAGDCEGAARLLGRPYRVRGVVVHGDGRGRQIGFPTANVALRHPYVLPRNGVYAVVVHAAEEADASAVSRPWPGVMNVGVRPTFGASDEEPRLEVHLFDFAGDLYGRELTVTFHAFLRPERRFASVEELTAQIGWDAAQARSLLCGIVSER